MCTFIPILRRRSVEGTILDNLLCVVYVLFLPLWTKSHKNLKGRISCRWIHATSMQGALRKASNDLRLILEVMNEVVPFAVIS